MRLLPSVSCPLRALFSVIEIEISIKIIYFLRKKICYFTWYSVPHLTIPMRMPPYIRVFLMLYSTHFHLSWYFLCCSANLLAHHAPHTEHMLVLKCILCYVRVTLTYGLHLYCTMKIQAARFGHEGYDETTHGGTKIKWLSWFVYGLCHRDCVMKQQEQTFKDRRK